jgi:hypothetical protein
MIYATIIILILIVCLVLSARDNNRLTDELETERSLHAFTRADFTSFKAMYGANPVSRLPECNGTVSDTVLMDIIGNNDPSNFWLVAYNHNTRQWCLVDDGTPIAFVKSAVWYRLPLKKYEELRMKR